MERDGGRLQRETYLLILRFLEASPCAGAFDVLQREAAHHGLLGARYDWTGRRHSSDYEHARRSAALPPPEHLQRLLEQLLELSRAQHPPSSRLSVPPLTLLSSGERSLSTVASAAPAAPLTGGRRILRGDASESFRAPAPSRLWSTDYRHPLSARADAVLRRRAPEAHLHALLSRELGVRLPLESRPPRSAWRAVEDVDEAGALLTPQAQLRGHALAAYCVVYDRTGGRIATGADDGNVKIWSARRYLYSLSPHSSHISHPILPISHRIFLEEMLFSLTQTHVAHMSHAILRIHYRHFLCRPSGLLQHTLRGHSGEITDLAIPPANTELISSSNDGTARVWSLRDGTPVRALPLCDD
jgi:hypothetical protein